MKSIGALAALVLLMLAGTASGATSVAEERIERAVTFLSSHQNVDGGFGEPGAAASDPTLSAWVALALDAADVDPAQLRRGGATLGTYLEQQSPEEATDIELQLLARVALGLETVPLVVALHDEIRVGGRIGPRLNSTIWGVLALHAAGEPVPRKAVRYIRRNQDRRGGFSFAAKGPPDTNDTAAAIQALRAAGIGPRAKPIKRAFRYLARTRRSAGGLPLVPGKAPDAQSTGWALQAYAAAGRKAPKRDRRFLVRLQRADGSVRYRKKQSITPVWVTAQALPGLLAAPFSTLA